MERKLFNISKLKYKENKIDKYTKYYEFENETVVVVMYSKSNTFNIKRKDFELIDNLLLPYAFLLINTTTNNKYYIEIEEPNNFLRNDFEYSKKDSLFFGKQLLQKKIDDEEILKRIIKLGE